MESGVLLSPLFFELRKEGQAIIINQVNNNVDTMILGAVVEEKSIITMYSSALAIYAVYNSIVSVMTNFFLPKATKMVTCNANSEQLTDFVIKPGRFQAMIGIACIVGFALFGRDFISIWIGDKYLDDYYIVLILMIPVTIPLVQNAVLSILDASLKRAFRSIVLIVMAIINIAVSLVLISFLSFWGAAIGTAFSMIVGQGIIMNCYYSKVFGLEIKRMFKEIFAGILPVGIASGVLSIPLAFLLPDTLLMFLLKVILFSIVYALGLWFFGLTEDEKKICADLLIFRRKNKS